MSVSEDYCEILAYDFTHAKKSSEEIQENFENEVLRMKEPNLDSKHAYDGMLVEYASCIKNLTEAKTNIDVIKVKLKKLESKKKELCELCQDRKTLNEKMLEEFEKVKKKENEMTAELKNPPKPDSTSLQIIQFCKKYFGLEVVVLHGKRLKFIFTNIIPDQPDTFAFLIISLEDNKIYRITECYPVINGIKQLEDALNKTNDLGGFISYSRKLLKDEWMKSN